MFLMHRSKVSYTIDESTNFTPFKLLYEEEAMTPEEIKFEGPRTIVQIMEEEEQISSKDLLEEERMKAIQNLEKYQKETKNWYNKKVKPRQLSLGDFVLKRKRNEDTVGKFQQKWEGLYLMTRTNKLGSFHLADMDGKEIDSLRNRVLLALQTGSGLQRTQQECHIRNLPHDPECRMHPQVNNI